ncbi:MAG: PAS domain S-box protein [Coprothermobacterota bacterium]|nr:PAS domain S-box protein [Coprothermobacterota bacterium]
MRISEGQKDAILNGITANIAFVDKDLRLLWVNVAAADSVNKSQAEMIGQTCHAFWADPAKPCENCPTVKAFQTKQTEHTLIYTPDGRVWDERGEPLFDERGNVIGVVEIAQDITERAWAEDALRKSEEKYRALVETANEAIIVTQDGALKFANSKASKLFGYSLEEGVGRPFVEFIHPDDRLLVTERYRKRLGGEVSTVVYPFRTIHKDGSIRWAEINSVRIAWEDRPAIMSYLSDITERKRVEEALSESEEWHRALVETTGHAGIGIVVLQTIQDRQAAIVFVNEAAGAMSGYSQEELQKMSLEDLIPPDIATQLMLRYRDRQEGKPAPNYYEAAIVNRDQVRIPVIASAATLKFHGQAATVVYVRDITDLKQAEETLRESEVKYRSVFNNFTDLYYQTDMQGLITNLSPSSFILSGWKPEELIGRQVLEIYPDPEQRKALLEKLRREGAVSDYEITLLHRDGRQVPVSVSSHLIRDKQKNPKYVEGTIRDITDRKQAEEALRIKDRAIESAIDAIAISDLEGVLTFVNPAFLKLWGYSSMADVLGKPVTGFWQMGEKAVEVIEALRARGGWIGELAAQRKDGSLFAVQVAASLVVDAAGQPIRMLASFADITERKRAEEALQESEEKYRRIVDTANEGILVSDETHRTTFANRRMAELLGYTREELIGRSIEEFTFPEELADHRQRMSNRRQGIGEQYERRLCRRDGSILWTNVSAAPILENGQFRGSIGLSTDITERKQLEERIHQVRSDLLFAVSHDLKSPLQALRQTQEMLGELPPAEALARFQEYGEIWRRNLERLERMINNLMDSQRGEEDRFPLLLAPCNPTELVKRAAEDLTGYALSSQVTFDLNLQPVPEDACDEEALGRVVENLLTNAVKFSPKGGKVEVRLEMEGDALLLEVEDHGLGIPANEIPQLFQPFQRGRSAEQRKVPGTGLGLYVCRRIMEAHGGSISLTSEEGKGTRVTVRLPWGNAGNG